MTTNTSESGYYIFPNGLHIEFGSITIELTETTDPNVITKYIGSSWIDFKKSFLSIPVCFCTCSNPQYWIGGFHGDTLKTTGGLICIGGNNNISKLVRYCVIGY